MLKKVNKFKNFTFEGTVVFVLKLNNATTLINAPNVCSELQLLRFHQQSPIGQGLCFPKIINKDHRVSAAKTPTG